MIGQPDDLRSMVQRVREQETAYAQATRATARTGQEQLAAHRMRTLGIARQVSQLALGRRDLQPTLEVISEGTYVPSRIPGLRGHTNPGHVILRGWSLRETSNYSGEGDVKMPTGAGLTAYTGLGLSTEGEIASYYYEERNGMAPIRSASVGPPTESIVGWPAQPIPGRSMPVDMWESIEHLLVRFAAHNQLT
jgi:hypothetical protein